MSNAMRNRKATKQAGSSRGKRKRPDLAKIAAATFKALRERHSAEQQLVGDVPIAASEAVTPATSALPALPGKGMPEWGPRYLEALEQTQGAKMRAAELIGLSYSAVHKAGLSHPDLDNAIRRARARWDDQHLAELEDLSMTQAKKAGNMTERFFNMKALDPGRYRDHTRPDHPGNIVIHFTAAIGNEQPATIVLGPDGKKLQNIWPDAEAEVVSSKPASRSRAKKQPRQPRISRNILGDDDVELEL